MSSQSTPNRIFGLVDALLLNTPPADEPSEPPAHPTARAAVMAKNKNAHASLDDDFMSLDQTPL